MTFLNILKTWFHGSVKLQTITWVVRLMSEKMHFFIPCSQIQQLAASKDTPERLKKSLLCAGFSLLALPLPLYAQGGVLFSASRRILTTHLGLVIFQQLLYVCVITLLINGVVEKLSNYLMIN